MGVIDYEALQKENLLLRRQVQEHQQGEKKFRQLLEFAPDAIVIVGQDGRIALINTQTESLFGYARKELENQPVEMLMPERFRAAHSGHLQRFFSELGCRPMGGELEFYGLRKDGGEFPIEISLSPIETGEEVLIAGAVRDITRRKQIEKELQENHGILNALIEGTADIVTFKDSGGRVMLANSACAKLLGKSADQIIGKTAAELIGSEAAEVIGKYDQQTLDSGKSETFEVSIKAASGQTKTLSTTKACCYSQAGELLGLVGIARDITDQKLAQDALRQSGQESLKLRNQLVEAIESLTEGFALYDAQDRLVICNSMYREIYKLSADLLIPGVRFEEHIRESAYRGQVVEAVGREEEWIAQRVAEHLNPQGGYLQQLGDGRWLKITETKTRDGGVAGVRTDITEQKLAEARQAVFGNILEDSLNELYIFSADTLRFIQVNRGARENLGYSSEELKKLTPLEIKAELSLAQFEDRLKPLRGGQFASIQFETVHRRKDGSTYPVEVHVQMSKYESSPVFVALVLNISRRKQFEERLEQRDAELAHVARVSTMGEMAAEIAHELSQPLHAISNFAEACLSTIDSKDPKETANLLSWLNIIDDQALKAGKIITRIKDFVRKDKPRLELIHINQLIQGILQLMQSTVRRFEIRVEEDLALSLPPLYGEKLHLEQVLVNIIRNGIEAMNECPFEQRTLTIRSCLREENLIEVSVSDAGPGLSAEKQKMVFEPFYTTKKNGLGVGLSICQTTVENHGGRLWIDSKHAQGASFHFTLPACSAENA